MGKYFVIGGSSGIGRATALQLRDQGHEVYASYHTSHQNDEPRLSYLPLDVLDSDWDLSLLPDELDGLAYCPGSIDLKPFSRVKEDEMMKDFELQVVGATKAVKKLMPRLRKSQRASIVFFSTVAVQKGYPFHAIVAASKGALEGLTRTLASELAPKIRVNAVAPSLTDTPLASKLLSTEEKKKSFADKNPLKQIGSPKNLADAATFLLQPSSDWITGQIIHVDGGASSLG